MGDRLRDKIQEIESNDNWNDKYMSKEESLAYVFSVLKTFNLLFVGLCRL